MANWFINQRRSNLLNEDPINNISDSPAKNLNKGYGAEVESSGGPPMMKDTEKRIDKNKARLSGKDKIEAAENSEDLN
jgi:hypothetical protein|tara:strand:- start:565 stop:798 length:234 start_codon:yes stop_codon:yes gene_type:complete